MTAVAGVLVDGRYRLVSQLGEGTFGSVWRAQDQRLSGRAVAVKLLKAEFLEHAEAVSRFEAEADALAQVQHPHVVAVHDRGAWGGHRFLVTELVEGRTLTDWLQRHRDQGVLPSLAAVQTLFEQLCAGIEAAHSVRVPGPIVHRDLKPDNVLVRELPNGEQLVKVLDFGIAQLGRRTGTRTGALMGTPLYMAPEQALGNNAAIAPSTDVFALGVVLVEMLTLRAQVDEDSPWWGTVLQREAEVRAMLGSLRRDVPPALWDLVAQSLRARGVERPPDAGALRTAFRRCLAAGPGLGVNPTPSPTAHGVSSRPTFSGDTLAAAPGAPVQAPTAPTVLSTPPPEPRLAATALSLPPVLGGSTTAPLTRHNPPHGAGPGRPLLPLALGAGVLVAGGVLWSLSAGSTSTQTAPTTQAPVAPPSLGAAPSATPLAAPAPRTESAPVPTPEPFQPPRPSAPVAGARMVTADPDLRDFLQRWATTAFGAGGTLPLDEFYPARSRFRSAGGLAAPEDIRRYFESHANQGGTFAIDLARSDWVSEPLDSPDANRVCAQVPGAQGNILKVRAWATEVALNRGGWSGGEVPCDRLEGRYLLRLRRVEGGYRICHETWSLCEGVCASCPAARACARCVPGG